MLRPMDKFQKTVMFQRQAVDDVVASSLAKVASGDSNNFNVDDVNDRLGRGDKEALNDLCSRNIPYNLTNNTNGYTVRYSYNGQNYVITCSSPTLEETASKKSDTNAGSMASVYSQKVLQNAYNFTTSEIEQYFKYAEYDLGNGKQSGWVLKTGQEVNGVLVNTLDDLIDALTKGKPNEIAQMYSQEVLQNAYNFTTSEIEQYFKYAEYDLGNGKQSGWVLKTGQEVNGVLVNTLDDLIDALTKGKPNELAQMYSQDVLQNAYNFTTSEIEQYFKYVEYDLGNGKQSGWVLKTGQEVNGVLVNTLDDLIDALTKGKPNELAQMYSQKILQNAYNIATSEKEEYSIAYSSPTLEETASKKSDTDAGSMANVYSQDVLQNAYNFTTSEIEQYFKYVEYDLGNGKQSGWVLKTGQEVNGVLVNTLDDLINALTKRKPNELAQMYSQEVLRNAYNFTTSEIEQYFKYVEYDLGNGKQSGWVLKTAQEVNGLVIENLDDLLKAIDKPDPAKLIGNNGVISSGAQTNPTTPEIPIILEEEENAEFTFDYTSVNSETLVEDMCNENEISNIEKLMSEKGLYNVDSGAWNDVFRELEKMKPQLMNYIKAQMENNGLEYNAENAEKYIEIYMTEAVQCSISDTRINFWDEDLEFPENPTIEDLVNYIRDRIDSEIEKYTVRSSENSYFDKAPIKFKGSTFNDVKYMQDYYLMDIADYFLVEGEKEMKFVMEVTQDNSSTHCTKDKDLLIGYVDTYAKHMEKVLKSEYSDFTDRQVDSIINAAKTYSLYMDPPEPNKEGLYMIDVLLKAFEEKCLEYAEK